MAKQRTLGHTEMSKKSHIYLEVRSFTSPDVELYSWKPITNAEVLFLVEMEIGEVGIDGADLFQVVIATPEALRKRAGSGRLVISDRSTIVISNFDWNHIRGALEALVHNCESESWVTSTLRLQRYFEWEYEDYQMEGES